MGKGGRNHARKYRIVVHSAEYYKKQRELKVRREKAKAIQNGEIYAGEMILPIPLLGILGLKEEFIKKNRDPKGVKC